MSPDQTRFLYILLVEFLAGYLNRNFSRIKAQDHFAIHWANARYHKVGLLEKVSPCSIDFIHLLLNPDGKLDWTQ